MDVQIRSGKDRFLALIDASTSRLRPVFLAAMTTILGMIPLVNDDMFGALAVTIMGGLFIGTVITLIILPILYSLFFTFLVRTKKKSRFLRQSEWRTDRKYGEWNIWDKMKVVA